MMTVLLAFTRRCQSRSHLVAAVVALWRLDSARLKLVLLEIRAVSSANCQQVVLALIQEEGRSIVYTTKSKGPRTEPRGTRAGMLCELENWSLICVRFLQEDR